MTIAMMTVPPDKTERNTPVLTTPWQKRILNVAVIVVVVLGVVRIGAEMLPWVLNHPSLQARVNALILEATGLDIRYKRLAVIPTFTRGLEIRVSDGRIIDDAPPAITTESKSELELNSNSKPNSKPNRLYSESLRVKDSNKALLDAQKITFNIRYWPVVTRLHFELSRLVFVTPAVYGSVENASRFISIRLDEAHQRALEEARKNNKPDPVQRVFVKNTALEVLNAKLDEENLRSHGLRLLVHELKVTGLFSKKPTALAFEGVTYHRDAKAVKKTTESVKPGFNSNTSRNQTLQAPWLATNVELTVKSVPELMRLLENPEELTSSRYQVAHLFNRASLKATTKRFDIQLGYRADKKEKHLAYNLAPLQLADVQQWLIQLVQLENLAQQLAEDQASARIDETQTLQWQLSGLRLDGTVSGQGKARIVFPEPIQAKSTKAKPSQAVQANMPILSKLKGDLNLKNVSVYSPKDDLFIVNDTVGNIDLSGKTLTIESLTTNVQETPVVVQGTVTLPSQTGDGALNITLDADEVKLAELKTRMVKIASLLDVQAPDFEHIAMRGRADAHLLIAGTPYQPVVTGEVVVTDGFFEDLNALFNVANINGALKLNQDGSIKLDSFSGEFNGANISVSGNTFANNTMMDLDIKTDTVSLPALFRAYQVQNTSSVETRVENVIESVDGLETPETLEPAKVIATQKAPIPQGFAVESGTAKVDLSLRNIQLSALSNPNNVLQAADISGYVNVENLGLRLPGLKQPVKSASIFVRAQNNTLVLPKTTLTAGALPLTLQGEFASFTQYNARVEGDWWPVAYLQNEIPALVDVPEGLPEFWNTEGQFKVVGSLSPEGAEGKLSVDKAGLSSPALDFPVYNANGDIAFGLDSHGEPALNDGLITFTYGNSPLQLKVNAANGVLTTVKGSLSPLVVNHYLTIKHATQVPYGSVPFNVSAESKSRSIASLLSATSSSGSPINFAAKFDLDRLFSIVKETPDAPAFLHLEGNVNGGSALVELAQLQLFDAGTIVASAEIDQLHSPAPKIKSRILSLPEIDVAKLSDEFTEPTLNNAEGLIALDMLVDNVVDGEAGLDREHLQAEGWLESTALKVPGLMLEHLTAALEFKRDNHTKIHIPSVILPGIQVSVDAEGDGTLRYPLGIENVVVRGAFFDVAGFQYFSKNIMHDIISKQFVSQIARPWEEGDPIVPISFTGGDIAINEVVYENIILSDVKSRMSLYGNGFMEMQNFELETAGGKANGYLSMSPLQNNFTTLELNMRDVSANALTRALLNVSNQLFGDISGSIRFTTQGMNEAETLYNANGTVKAKITDGRLPAVAKIETLLTAANVVRGGVLGLNLSNILRTVAPFNTNYFAEMSGSMLIAREHLYTDDMLSDGENLDLLIQGSIGMAKGDADLVVNGTMSQTVKGKLGKLGALSLGSFFRYIPLIGFIPGTKQAGIINRIPGVGFTPGLGGLAGEESYFRVKIQGPMEDPSSVKAFEWIREP